MDDHAVIAPGREHCAETVAPSVRQMLLSQKGVAEGQPCGYSVFAQQGENRLRVVIPEADASAAPDAVCGRTVYRAYVAPVVKPLPMLAEKRQKHPIQLVELKQSGKVVVNTWLYHFSISKSEIWLA